jgi:hypothetical protein
MPVCKLAKSSCAGKFVKSHASASTLFVANLRLNLSMRVLANILLQKDADCK